jgi:hypothetical protein
VEPKRKALAQANAELAAAQDKLSVIKRKVAVSVFSLISSSFYLVIIIHYHLYQTLFFSLILLCLMTGTD